MLSSIMVCAGNFGHAYQIDYCALILPSPVVRSFCLEQIRFPMSIRITCLYSHVLTVSEQGVGVHEFVTTALKVRQTKQG